MRATAAPAPDGWISATLWTITSPWPNHPALLPPLPRESRSSQVGDGAAAYPTPRTERTPARQPAREQRGDLRRPRSAAGVYRTPASSAVFAPAGAPKPPTGEQARHVRRHVMSPATSADARPVRPPTRQQAHARAAGAHSVVSSFPANLDWPTSFDDWMIDIIRRRALRLNSGARRRGAGGSVRAVELAHIMEQSRDEQGRWRCAICQRPVTLDDLSFDHIVALADGGEHAAHNLAPAHRKCNEIKGSEKAQYRAQSLDRWLSDWASGQPAPGAGPALALASTQQPRYA